MHHVSNLAKLHPAPIITLNHIKQLPIQISLCQLTNTTSGLEQFPWDNQFKLHLASSK